MVAGGRRGRTLRRTRLCWRRRRRRRQWWYRLADLGRRRSWWLWWRQRRYRRHRYRRHRRWHLDGRLPDDLLLHADREPQRPAGGRRVARLRAQLGHGPHRRGQRRHLHRDGGSGPRAACLQAGLRGERQHRVGVRSRPGAAQVRGPSRELGHQGAGLQPAGAPRRVLRGDPPGTRPGHLSGQPVLRGRLRSDRPRSGRLHRQPGEGWQRHRAERQ